MVSKAVADSQCRLGALGMYMCTCMYVCMYIHVHKETHIHKWRLCALYIYTYIHTYIGMCVQKRKSKQIDVLKHSLCTYIHRNIHTYIQQGCACGRGEASQ